MLCAMMCIYWITVNYIFRILYEVLLAVRDSGLLLLGVRDTGCYIS